MKKVLQISSVIVGLSGCGGGSATDPVDARSEFATATNRYEGLQAIIDSTPFSTSAQIPTEGTATYRGYAGYGNPSQPSIAMISDAELIVDFGASTVAGSLSNFRTSDGGLYNGTVAIQIGTIGGPSANRNLLQAGLAGTLSNTAGSNYVTGNLSGAFSGPQAEFTDGLISGSFAGAPLTGYLYGQRP